MMLLIASLAPLMAVMAAPAGADDSASIPGSSPVETRCALHHLPIPSGKGAVTAIMRCAKRQPNDSQLSMREKTTTKAPRALLKTDS